MQWAKKCPNRSKNNSTNLVDVSDEEDGFKNVQIILMRRASINNEIFVNEMFSNYIQQLSIPPTLKSLHERNGFIITQKCLVTHG